MTSLLWDADAVRLNVHGEDEPVGTRKLRRMLEMQVGRDRTGQGRLVSRSEVSFAG